MRRAFAAACVVVVGLGMAPPVQAAGTGEQDLSGVHIAYSVGDATFDGPGCAQIPWTITFTRPQFYNIYMDAELQQVGSNETFTYESMNTLSSAPLTGMLKGSICAPDKSDASRGVFLVKSSMTVEGEHLRSTAVDLETLPATVRQNPSRIVKLKLTREHTFGWGHVEGRAAAQTPTRGRIGAGGTVRLDYLASDGWRTFHEWATINDVGDFRDLVRNMPTPGTRVRAVLVECGWCTTARKKSWVR